MRSVRKRFLHLWDRAWFKASLYLVGVVALSVLVLESFVRFWILPQDFHFYDVRSREFPYFRLHPEYNEDGVTIRNSRRELLPRGQRPHRIAFVGDSNTFGVGVRDSETYVELVQRDQERWDTYNFGVPGYGLPEIRSVVDAITSKERYDVVAYNYNINDVVVAMTRFLPLLSAPQTRLRTIDEYEGGSGMAKLFAKDHFKFLFILPSVLYASRMARRHPMLNSTPRTTASAKTARACYEPLRDGVYRDGRLVELYRRYETIYSDERLLTEVAEHFTHIREQIARSGGRLVVFSHYDLPTMALPIRTPQEKISQILTGMHIATLETFPVYRAHFQECGFFSDFGHLGPVGTRYVASLLENYLKSIHP